MDNNIPKCAIIMNLPQFKADQILNEEREYDFRKSPLKERSLGRKVYLYAGNDINSIMGYCFVDKCICGNRENMYKIANFDKREMRMIDRYFEARKICYALHFIDPVEFEKYLPISTIYKMCGDVCINKYLTNISLDDPIFHLITDWDQAYSLDGALDEIKNDAKKRILTKNYR